MELDKSIFWAELCAAILSAILLSIIPILWKLFKTMSRIDAHIESTEAFKVQMIEKTDRNSRRIDVHDVLWSSHYKKSVSSAMIVDGDMDYPQAPRERR